MPASYRERQISIHAPAKGATDGDTIERVPRLFQSTLPRRERQFAAVIADWLRKISIHAPAKGATMREFADYQAQLISIHAPAKGATLPATLVRASFRISIHAPAKGATLTGCLCRSCQRNFNPRSREGSDSSFTGFCVGCSLFQSTLPRRERLDRQIRCCVEYEFQSTLPRRERPRTSGRCWTIEPFQSTLPRRERPPGLCAWSRRSVISIHAPAKGATIIRPATCFPTHRFQSTLPRRERH